jgi:hypothetical protein
MTHRAKLAVCIAMFLGVLVPSSSAWACGAGETQRYQSQWAIWCVDDTVWTTGQDAFQGTFFPYGDAVVQELETLFGVTPTGLPLIIEAVAPDGGAQTPPKCCGSGCDQNPCLGEAVTGDAYYNVGYNVQGFWGYLLTLHELINQWTGYVTSGWPTDFWADHVSAFPNSMDWQIMAALGTKLNDANLTASSAAQKARFYPGGDSVDPRVPMFDDIFALPNSGFEGWTNVFAYIRGDQMSWDDLGVANPAELRTEYVTAYVSLGPGQSVLPILQSANVANGTQDGVQGDVAYTATEANVDAIATAHCSIAAAAAQGGDETADRAALTSGNFAGVTAHGTCGAGCPSECGCKTSANLCVAPWLADEVEDGGMHADDAGGGSDSGASTPDGGAGQSIDAGLPAGDAGGFVDDGSPAAPSGCNCELLGDRERGTSAPSALAIAGLVAAVVTRLRPRRR